MAPAAVSRPVQKLANMSTTMKSAIAVAASILGAVFHILKNRVPYKELGDQPRDQKSVERTVQALTRKLEGFGYEVQLKPTA